MVTPAEVMRLFWNPPEGPLYHYTNQRGLLGILRTKQLWATHVSYLNDASELSYARNLFQEQLKLKAESLGSSEEHASERAALKRIEEHLAENGAPPTNALFVASLSKARDSLPQWRAYAPLGGYCLAFDAAKIAQRLHHTHEELRCCVYRREDQVDVVRRLIDGVLWEDRRLAGKAAVDVPTSAMSFYLNYYGSLLKNPVFSDEMEWRIVLDRSYPATPEFRTGRSSLIPYLSIPLCDDGELLPLIEIIVGPTPELQNSRRAAEYFLWSLGRGDVPVNETVVPHREW